MTADEFEQGYAQRSGVTVERLREDRKVVPCDCGEDICDGWGSVSLDGDVCGECGGYEWIHPHDGCPGFTNERRWPRREAAR